jgi:N-acetylneuraminic acid mutarotase
LTRIFILNADQGNQISDIMTKIITLLLVIISVASCLLIVGPAFSSTNRTEDSWISKAPMPTARYALGVAVVDGKIYAIGGYDSSLRLLGNNEMYDPTNDTWTTLAPMPTPRAQFGIAVYQNKIYVIGGIIGIAPYFRDNAMGISVMTGINEVYDPATNTWETKASMPTERGIMQANTVDGKIYITGGFTQNSQFSNSTEAYNPASDSWTTMTPMPVFQEEFSSAVVDSKIFFISDKVQIFDPKSNQWTMGTSPPNAVYQGAAGATTGSMAPKRIYVIHGGTGFNQIYNPDNDSWTTGASIPNLQQNRLTLAVAVVNDTIYAIGGSNTNDLGANILATNDQYTPIGYGTLPEPTPSQQIVPFSTIIIAASGISAVLAIIGIAIYFKKRKCRLSFYNPVRYWQRDVSTFIHAVRDKYK